MTTDRTGPVGGASAGAAAPEPVAMSWLAHDGIDARAGLGLARMTVAPGVLSPAHRHPGCPEVLHVLAGDVFVRRGESWERAAVGETVVVPAGDVHQVRNDGPGAAVVLVAWPDGSRPYVAAV